MDHNSRRYFMTLNILKYTHNHSLRNLVVRGCLGASLLFACNQAVSAQDGSTAYNYLNVTSSARIYGLGGVNITTVEDELSTADQNPGLLGSEMNNQILVDYMRYLGNSNFAGIKYAHAVGERGAWSAGIRYFGYGEMTAADETGVITGTFSPKDINFSGTFSYDITNHLRGGITMKMLYSSYEEYSAFAVATDLGINYYDPDHDWSFSAVIANLGGQLKKFNENYDKLPIDLRLGATKGFTGIPLRLSVTLWNLRKWSLPYYNTGDGTSTEALELKESFGSNLFRHMVFGVDFTPSDRFFIALGYNYKTRTDMSTYKRSFLSGFSLSAGMNVSHFNFAIAFSQPHSGATSLMFNLNLNLQDFIQ
jgi:hypothetical protein